jgi:hypothetical protein
MHSCEVFYLLFKDLSTYEAVEFCMKTILPLKGGRQAHPERRGKHLCYVPVSCCSEVMDFIEYYQAKSVSELIGVNVCRVIGGYR